MSENKIKRLLKLRYFFALILISFYLLYKILVQWKYPEFYPDYLFLVISAILLLFNNNWTNRFLIFLNIYDFASQLTYVVQRCQDNFSVNVFGNCFYWLKDINFFLNWNFGFWILQIGLIIYLVTLEIVIYKNKNFKIK